MKMKNLLLLLLLVATTPVYAQESKVFDIVEQMPSFPGGQGKMFKFLATNIRYPVVAEVAKNTKYPVRAQENGISGAPVVQFTVEADGTLIDFHIVKSVNPDLDAEALRVAKNMPKWIPAKDKDGNAKRATYAISVSFGLH